ncbi:short-chain fatty acyl-CoA regulator family protein [Gordonia paraffinivorans]|uniref:Xre family DNA-binding protein n=1 Tax=Gordonia paraffinivorans NBRC 108238 TaxID=1223543 RepID=A0ABQ0IGG6_9ACTN|nr:short-chain fatty acyl-CoA regulator family protein [Gordonia paraffinivorans]GAC82524.1 putative Xre family DNA-binding protein [Gordonia paraffinivorans NBRC 108238]
MARTSTGTGRLYVGARLRRLRADHGLSQAALARRINLSTSYVNQLENDQRPITVPVLMTLTREFGLDPNYFSADGDARLVADVVDALAPHIDLGDSHRSEVAELVARMPDVAHALVSMHRSLSSATTELETYRAHVTEPGNTALPPMPFEEVRDFFYDNKNHFVELDDAAESLFEGHRLSIGGLDVQLTDLLASEYDVRVKILAPPGARAGNAGGPKRRFDTETRTLYLARTLTSGQRAFQMATQIALMTQDVLIERLIAGADRLSQTSVPVARIGLANYFAGALILPYSRFLHAAEEWHYDIEMLGLHFEVGFETVCHRLSTLQRPGNQGVPFIFVRTDRAGNISKRQSATAFHFSRVGGSCPLWVVHDAFTAPGRIHIQVSQMPDGRSYFWVARTTDDGRSSYLGTRKTFAVGLGCDLTHAHKLVYSTGVDLHDPRTMVPIGAGCKVCERDACPQRAFPQIGRPLNVDSRISDSIPYRPAPDTPREHH